jgi:serine/threonine protein phosphatase PrpC
MEDAVALVGDFAGSGSSYFAIFDGHNGPDVSKYAANNIHRVFNKNYSSDIDIPEMLFVTVAEVNEYLRAKWPEQGSTAAIAIVIKDYIYTANTGDSRIVIIDAQGGVHQVSVDHTVSDGSVQGVLALSRSLGDGTRDGHSGEPHMTRTHRKDGMWMIIASAGVWSVLDNETAARIGARKGTTSSAANAIKDEAIKRGTRDNVSVIVVFLTPK